jgi:hypothetical protein
MSGILEDQGVGLITLFGTELEVGVLPELGVTVTAVLIETVNQAQEGLLQPAEVLVGMAAPGATGLLL